MATLDPSACPPSEAEDSDVCMVCRGEQCRTLFSEPEFRIRECSRCLLAWTLPASYVQQSSYEGHVEYAESYAGREAAFRGYADQLLKPLRRWQPNGRLLDIGCSVGFLVDEANRRGYQAEGIDLDGAAVQIGRDRGRPLTCSTLEDWPGRDYDVICASHTLEHVQTPAAFLQEAAEHLRPGGYLALVVPCHSGLHPRIFGRRWYGWVAHQHYFHYSAKALSTLLTQTGFVSVSAWQNSLDYRAMLRPSRSPLRFVRGVLEFATATLGSFVGAGDQLVVVGRRPPP